VNGVEPFPGECKVVVVCWMKRIGVLGEEIGPHNATAPGTSLAADHRAHPVPFVCPGLPLSAW